MAAEANVGARLFLIGKDGVLAGYREIQAAVARLNAEIAKGAAASERAAAASTKGAKASKGAAAATAEQTAALARQQAVMDAYRTNLATVTAETDALARVGKVAFYAIAAAAAAWGYESIKWARQYQTALVQLHTQAGLTVGAMNAIGRAAKANAAGLGIGPTTYLQAAYHPASAGFSTRETIAITNAAAKLAGVGGAPTETTVNALTGIMKSYNLPKSKVMPTTALLNAIIGAGNMHAATLNAALASGVAPTAKTFGVSLASLGGAIAFMTDRGVPAAQAGTHLRMTLSLLGAPSKLAATLLRKAGMATGTITKSQNALSQTLQEAGVTPTQLSRALRTEKGNGGIYNALHLLKSHLTAAGLTSEMQGALISRSFGGGRMGSTVMMMYNDVASLGAKSAKISRAGSTAAFMKDWADYTKTATFQFKRFDATVKTLGITFGEKLLPVLTRFLSMLSTTLTWLGKNKAIVYALGTVITAVLAPAIGLYLYRALLSSGGAIKTVLRGYANLLSGQTAEQLALKRTQAQLALTTGETEALAGADRQLAGAASTAAGSIAVEDAAMSRGGMGILPGVGGKAGLKGLLSGAAGKLGMGAMIASIATPLMNSMFGKQLQHSIGSRGKTDLMDALSGAETGMMFGPEGALIGGLAGLTWGERGHLARDLNVAGHDTVHGLDVARHSVAHWFDNIFGGGGSSAPKPIHVRSDVHVYLTGREVTKRVKAHVRHEAAVAGA